MVTFFYFLLCSSLSTDKQKFKRKIGGLQARFFAKNFEISEMWAAIDDDVHSDVRKTIDASRRQRYIIQENRVPYVKTIMLIVLAMAVVMLKMTFRSNKQINL